MPRHFESGSILTLAATDLAFFVLRTADFILVRSNKKIRENANEPDLTHAQVLDRSGRSNRLRSVCEARKRGRAHPCHQPSAAGPGILYRPDEEGSSGGP